MKSAVHIPFVLFFLLLSLNTASAGVYSDPTRPPSFPRDPPPAADRGKPVSVKAPDGEAFTVTYELQKGWNVLSFPFRRVLETRGFQRKLLRYAGGAYYAVDPVTDLATINTRYGYLVYADAPVKATARGLHNNREIRSISLESGWNLIGCPSSKSAPWNRLAAVIGTSTQFALDVAGLPGGGENYWLSSRAYRFDRVIESYDIQAQGAVIPSKLGLWVFAWHPLTLTVAAGTEQAQKLRIDRVTPVAAAPGQTVTIDGNGFYTTPSGLYLSGVPIGENYILSWSPTRIVFRLPSYVVSGTLAVVVNGTPSNKVEFKVSEGGSVSASATLTGKVQDGNKNPLSGALVMLGNGLSTYSAADGTFLIERIPAGDYSVQGSLTGHRSAQGKISLQQGVSKGLLITLTSYDEVITSAPPAEKQPERKKDEHIVSEKGTLYAVASAYYYGGKRWWVYRIEVSEWGNTGYYWHNTWYNDVGDVYYELKCPGARIGKTYNFKIEWRTKDGSKVYNNTFQRKMYKQYQKENFDSPY